MLEEEFYGTVSSRMVASLPWIIKMSVLTEVLITDGGTVEGGCSTARWLGKSAKILADGINS